MLSSVVFTATASSFWVSFISFRVSLSLTANISITLFCRKNYGKILTTVKITVKIGIIMENNELNRSCKDCVFFVQHYAEVDGEFCAVFCGHCICLEDKARENFIVTQKDKCGHFKYKAELIARL